MHNGKESIMNNDLQEIKNFIKSLLLMPDKEQSANTTSKISTASNFSAHDEFLTKHQFRNIDELIDLPKMATKGNLGEVVTTCERSWVQASSWGFPSGAKKEWGLSPKAKVRVLHTAQLDVTYAFKIAMDEWQSKKLLPSWTVQKMSDDPEIINALIPMITPSNGQTSDATIKDTTVSHLDLASVTDDNKTPSNLLKIITSTPNNNSSTNKRNGDGVLDDEASNTKRQLIDKMGEKN
uniref:Uncharacterized protein n=1 Tax=Tanacetum cinerariifolium TaxID=118510 RepID=A0A6L2NCT0_TANCI|nr:hypothetical protein [Tanacetum cinerariifolium]